VPRKPKIEEEDEGPDKGWLESWADAMTLLMAFFIMLFAFALVDETKFFDFKVGMVTALGVSDPITEQGDSILESGNGIALEVGLSTVPSVEIRNQVTQGEGELEAVGEVTTDNVEDVRDLLAAKFIENGAADFVSVDIDERGVVVRYDGRVLFESGSAELGDDSDVVLAATADVLQLIDNPVDIEGHTDDIPTGSRWISNWELSGARASAVVRWMTEFGSIPPRRLAAVGMAETRPLVPNDSDENRQENRRVEVVIRVAGLLESEVDVIDPIGDPIPSPIIDESVGLGTAVPAEDDSDLDAADPPQEPVTTPEEPVSEDDPPTGEDFGLVPDALVGVEAGTNNRPDNTNDQE
jgi:chemotaxis protein MotB